MRLIFSLSESIMLQTSPIPIRSVGSLLNICSKRTMSSLEYLEASVGGNLMFEFICASFSPGLNGDLKYIKVYMMQAKAHTSTFSVIGNPEYRSSYSGAR